MKNGTLGEGYNTLSIVYNGKMMTKAELVLYLFDLTDLKREIDDLMYKMSHNDPREDYLKSQLKRREVIMPYMEKPKGLAALSKRKKEEYQRWVNDAPRREEERKRKEAEETARIEGVKKELDAITKEAFARIGRSQEIGKKYTDLLLMHVIAPEYRTDNIPELLLNYLWTGRAHTLTDAINIYHEEKYRLEMRAIAEQQLAEARVAQQRQLDIAWQQMRELKEQRVLQERALEASEEAKKAAKNAEFISYLHFWADYS